MGYARPWAGDLGSTSWPATYSLWSWTGPLSSPAPSFLTYKVSVLSWISCSHSAGATAAPSAGETYSTLPPSPPGLQNSGLPFQSCHCISATSQQVGWPWKSVEHGTRWCGRSFLALLSSVGWQHEADGVESSSRDPERAETCAGVRELNSFLPFASLLENWLWRPGTWASLCGGSHPGWQGWSQRGAEELPPS